jgi:hypothetical protein
MNVDALVAQLEGQRLLTVELEEGVTAKVETPSVFRAIAISQASGDRAANGDELLRLTGLQIRSWSGVTTAKVLGSSVGSDEEAPYDPRLWKVLAGRRIDWVDKVAAAAMAAAMKEHQEVSDASKN